MLEMTRLFFLQSLIDITQKVFKACQSRVGGGAKRNSTVTTGDGGVAGSRERPFDTMNNIVANLLLNLTRLFSTVLVKICTHAHILPFSL